MTHFIKQLYFAIGLLLASTSLIANAAALTVPEAFDVLSVNGVEQTALSLAKEKRLALQAGRNIIVLEYDEIFDSQLNDSHESVRSQAYALIFEVVDESELTLRSPDITDLASAKQYAKHPSFDIVNAQQKNIALTTMPAKDLTFGTVINADTTIINNLAPPERGVLPKEVTPRMPFEKAPSVSPRAGQPDALNMLRYWWGVASTQEQDAFLQEIKQQNETKTLED